MANGRLRCLGSAQHLKDKFGKGFQIELKTKLVDKNDDDYVRTKAALAQSVGVTVDEESNKVPVDEMILCQNLNDLHKALMVINPEGYLVSLVNENNPNGYILYKNAAQDGVTLDEVASFATTEMRLHNVELFMKASFRHATLRERQDTKVRYQVSSKGVRIANLFATIEANKENLQLADYGISQTSLEQVFNMHAAEAEKLKEGRDDH
jgi:ATP-binding cassette, subfamily A (ABC1), member 3